MKYFVIALCLVLTAVSAVANSFEDKVLDGARRVRREIEPVAGRRTIVVISEPVIDMGSSLDADLARAAFKKVFVNELRAITGSETDIEYRDSEYFPELQRVFETELARVRDNPDLIRQIMNQYHAQGTYDYIILTRMQSRSGHVYVEHLVVRPSGVRRLVVGEIAEEVVHGEGLKFGADLFGGVTKSTIAVTSRDSAGRVVTQSVDSPNLNTVGVGVDVKSDYVYALCALFRDRQPSGQTNLDYITDRQIAGIEGVPVHAGRLGLLIGYNYAQQKYGVGTKDTSGQDEFSNQFIDHTVSLGFVYGNLHNGFSLAAAGRRGMAHDVSNTLQFANVDDKMWSDTAVFGRFLWNRTTEHNEVRFVAAGGPVKYRYNSRYYGRDLGDGTSTQYEVSFRYRYIFHNGARFGFGGEHISTNYRQVAGTATALLAQQSDTTVYLQLGFVLGGWR